VTAGGRAAVFVDRDGVINALVPDPVLGTPESPYRPQDVLLAPGAVAGLRALRAAGYVLVAASNQPGASKGTTTLEALDAVHQRVVALLEREGVHLDDWRYCHHHPQGTVAELTRACPCRKPRPGLLEGAARDLGLDLARSWMVGDADTDVEAGRAAGARTVLVEHPDSPHRRGGEASPDARAPDLAGAARAILGRDRGATSEYLD
jgi:D-glycero-D-manno-heptose 1,7-bisphosphate phosphatase